MPHIEYPSPAAPAPVVPPWSRLVGGALLALSAGTALAQDVAGPARIWAIEPSISLRQTITDNQALQAAKESDSVTEAVGGIRVSGTGRNLRGLIDYALTGSVHVRHKDANEFRHSLIASGVAELIEGLAFLDLRGTYTRVPVSAYGSQSTQQGLAANNQADVASLSISPHIRGQIGGAVRYDVRFSQDVARAKGTDLGDSESSAASVHLGGGVGKVGLDWFADATHNVSDFRAGRRSFDSRGRIGLGYVVNTDLKVGISGGNERTDLVAADGLSTTTYGASVEWTPTERTSLSADAEKRFFGTAHALRFAHRTPSTVWTFSDSRDVSSESAKTNASLSNVYDLFFRQFATIEPDPVKRDVAVRTLLQANGINPSAVVVGGFLASAATLQRLRSASFAIVGVRNVLTILLSSARSERADKVASVLDDLSRVSEVRQRGLTLDWAYRVTPSSSISIAGAYQRTDGDVSAQQTTLKTIVTTWTGTLSPRSGWSAGARHAIFDSTTTPYVESAVFASFRMSF